MAGVSLSLRFSLNDIFVDRIDDVEWIGCLVVS